MKPFLITAAAACACAAAPASSSVYTLGSSYAESCYRAAEARDITRRSKDACDKALYQGLPLHDIVGTHVNRGILHLISGDYVRANLDFDAALQINPRQPEAWLNKSIAQLKAGNSRAALEMANKSLALGTVKPAIAFFVRGVAKEDTGNVRGAYADLKHAAALAPKWREPELELVRYRVLRR